jgi:hypothetical protein
MSLVAKMMFEGEFAGFACLNRLLCLVVLHKLGDTA